MQKTILIGATGFVGTNLREFFSFDALASSRNISEYAGQHFDLAIIAAGDARKWFANQHPQEDLVHVEKLIADVCAIEADRFLHFSTVDVYSEKAGTENELSGRVSNDAYGGHRFLLEEALKKKSEETTTIRLPGLYGPGLKKNIIFDISNQRDISGFNPDSTFQWFDLLELKHIVEFALAQKMPEFNVAVEPVSVGDLLDRLDIDRSKVSTAAPLVRYDIRTIYDLPFGGSGGYLYNKTEALDGIERFLKSISRS